MKTLNRIEIAPASPGLTKYTHCSTRHAAENLRDEIESLEAAGFTVTEAIASRGTVPTSYRSAYKMIAPCYVFYPETREIALITTQLENRPRGHAIPARFEITGDVVPPGFRCFRRNPDSLEIRRS